MKSHQTATHVLPTRHHSVQSCFGPRAVVDVDVYASSSVFLIWGVGPCPPLMVTYLCVCYEREEYCRQLKMSFVGWQTRGRTACGVGAPSLHKTAVLV